MRILPKSFTMLCTVAWVALGSLLPSRASAAPAPYPISVSSQDQRAPSLSTFQAEPRTFRVTFKDGTNISDVSSATVFMGWATNAYANTYVTSVWSKVDGGSNGVVDFTFSAADLNTNGSLIYFVGAGSTYRQGALTIAPNPWSTGVSAPTLTSNVNMDLYTWSGGPFIRSVDASNSFALAADVAATNAGLQSQIDGFVSGQGVTTNIKVGAGSSGLLTVSNGSSAEVTLNFDDSGLATDAELSAAQADASNQFVNVAGDTMTGSLFFNQQAVLRVGETGTNYTLISTSPTGGGLGTLSMYDSVGGIWFYATTAGTNRFFRVGNDVSLNPSPSPYVFESFGKARIYNTLVVSDPTDNAILTLSATGGLQVGQNSFKAFPSGDISQDSTNTATLGVVTGNTFAANSFTGGGSGLSGVNAATLQSYTAQQVADLERSTANFDFTTLSWSPTVSVSRADGVFQRIITQGPTWIQVPAGLTNMGYMINLEIGATTNSITFLPDNILIATNLYTYTNRTMSFLLHNAWDEDTVGVYGLKRDNN